MGAFGDVSVQLVHPCRFEIKDAPAARLTAGGSPVVYLARIDADEAARAGFHLPAIAERGMPAMVHDSDTILIMRMAREHVRGACTHHLDPHDRKGPEADLAWVWIQSQDSECG
jgi:hypothetical protein